MSTPTMSLALLVPSRLGLVDKVCQTVSGYLNSFGLGEDDIYSFDLSLREAVVNAMKHGNHWHEVLKVGVLVEITGNNCIIRVRDSGKQRASIPGTPGNLLAPNGRGLLIMRSIMDTVEFNRTNDAFEIAMSKCVDLHDAPSTTCEFETRISTRTAYPPSH